MTLTIGRKQFSHWSAMSRRSFGNGETKLPQNEDQEVGNGDNVWVNIQVPINEHVKILDVHVEVPQ